MKFFYYIFLFLTISTNAYSATARCTGQISTISSSIYGDQSGTLAVSMPGTNFMRICRLDSQFHRTSPETCKLYSSLILFAKASNKVVNIQIDNAPTSNCPIGPWFGADVRHIWVSE